MVVPGLASLRRGSIPRPGPGAAVGVVLVWSGLLGARGKEGHRV